MRALTVTCDHPSLLGAEGPINTLGRWPVLWECCTCHALLVRP